MATKNDGALMPNVATPMMALAPGPSPRQASINPNTMPSTKAKPMAAKASNMVAGNASTNASTTGRPPK